MDATGVGRPISILPGLRLYWMALPTCEKTLLAFEPIRRTVPTTMTRITASMTEYSAMSWPASSDQSCKQRLRYEVFIDLTPIPLFSLLPFLYAIPEVCGTADCEMGWRL